MKCPYCNFKDHYMKFFDLNNNYNEFTCPNCGNKFGIAKEYFDDKDEYFDFLDFVENFGYGWED